MFRILNLCEAADLNTNQRREESQGEFCGEGLGFPGLGGSSPARSGCLGWALGRPPHRWGPPCVAHVVAPSGDHVIPSSRVGPSGVGPASRGPTDCPPVGIQGRLQGQRCRGSKTLSFRPLCLTPPRLPRALSRTPCPDGLLSPIGSVPPRLRRRGKRPRVGWAAGWGPPGPRGVSQAVGVYCGV